MRMMNQLLCLLVLVLMASFAFAAGEGGWKRVSELTGLTVRNPIVYFDHKLITPGFYKASVIDTGEVGSWNWFSAQGYDGYNEVSNDDG